MPVGDDSVPVEGNGELPVEVNFTTFKKRPVVEILPGRYRVVEKSFLMAKLSNRAYRAALQQFISTEPGTRLDHISDSACGGGNSTSITLTMSSRTPHSRVSMSLNPNWAPCRLSAVTASLEKTMQSSFWSTKHPYCP